MYVLWGIFLSQNKHEFGDWKAKDFFVFVCMNNERKKRVFMLKLNVYIFVRGTCGRFYMR